MAEKAADVIFLNLDKAEHMMEHSADPLVRALLTCVYSTMTAALPKRPEGAFDMAYCFEMLAAALPRTTLERLVNDPVGILSPELDM